jgi:hypothetical protein
MLRIGKTVENQNLLDLVDFAGAIEEGFGIAPRNSLFGQTAGAGANALLNVPQGVQHAVFKLFSKPTLNKQEAIKAMREYLEEYITKKGVITPSQVIKEVSESVNQNISDDLISEAKKYKSAEEFVKAQTDPLFEFKTGVGIKDEFIARGTVKEAINDIGGIKNVERGFMDKNKLEVTENINTSSQRYRQVLDEVKKGERTPIIANEYGEVLDGHHRLKAYEEIGLKEIPVVAPKGTPEIKVNSKSQLTDIWNKANKL